MMTPHLVTSGLDRFPAERPEPTLEALFEVDLG